jgi:hypothetical protein
VLGPFQPPGDGHAVGLASAAATAGTTKTAVESANASERTNGMDASWWR